jgi:hypothetical protein
MTNLLKDPKKIIILTEINDTRQKIKKKSGTINVSERNETI